MKKGVFTLLTASLCLLAACGTSSNSSKEIVMKSDYTVNTEVVEIPSGDNTLYGTLYTPETDSKTPLIIMCHGYNGVGDDFQEEGKYFAQNGIATYTLDFCGGSTRSKSTGETKDMTIFTEKADLLNAYNYFKTQDNIDNNNIFLFGGSQGGLVTTLATEELGDEVAGMALYFPALCIADNWRETFPETDMIPKEEEFWGMTLGKNFFESIHDFDVFSEIGSYPNNVLILHGDKDEIVPLSYSEKAASIYEHAKLIVMEGEGHGFAPEAAKTAREDVLSFMKENIR
uniref:CinII n=1 Tax=Butyrivibrio fibrisolvens TaxID=831 RepID=P94315_BUTFI|nr:CinII [Butyrivibrio fibrisolvens]